jgi:hypothetical protein
LVNGCSTRSRNDNEIRYAVTSAKISLRLLPKPRVTPETNRSEFVGPGTASIPNTSSRKMDWLVSSGTTSKACI